MMTRAIREDAHAVLLPAFATTRLSDPVKKFLQNGGCSILLGESREEYVAREMDLQRRRDENRDTFTTITGEASSLAGEILVAVDQEIHGICRLHDLVPSFPLKEKIEQIRYDEFEALSADIARAAKGLGVNCFLAPILDIVTGVNPWLNGRTWSTEPDIIARISSAYIRGLQTNGVVATAKHFPGYSRLDLDPAIYSGAVNCDELSTFERNFHPFIEAIHAGVEMIMTGPAVVTALDPINPASTSMSVMNILREQLGFTGVVMSDDLDAKAILGGNSITQVAVDALHAGSDFLLIGDIDNQIDQIVSAIIAAVESGRLGESRLHQAAARVRSLAARYGNG